MQNYQLLLPIYITRHILLFDLITEMPNMHVLFTFCVYLCVFDFTLCIYIFRPLQYTEKNDKNTAKHPTFF